MASKSCKELLCVLYSGLLFISGALLIGYTAYLGYKLVYHFKFVPSECIAPYILLLLLAVVHVLLTWLGVNGPRRQHLFHVGLFIVLTIVLILAELTIAIWCMVLWGKVAEKSLDLMTSSFDRFLKDNYDKSDWVKLQSKMHCCGINNETDYIQSSISGSIPISCCNSTTGTACPQIYHEGCKNPFISYVKGLLVNAAAVGFASSLFQCLGVVAFYYFYKAVKEEVAKRAEIARAVKAQEENPLQRRASRGSRK